MTTSSYGIIAFARTNMDQLGAIMGRRVFSYDYETFVRDPLAFNGKPKKLRRLFSNMLQSEKDELLLNMDLAHHIWRVTRNRPYSPEKIRRMYKPLIDAFNDHFGLSPAGEPAIEKMDGQIVAHHKTRNLAKLCHIASKKNVNVWEFPKGSLSPRAPMEAPIDCAIREFVEETGADRTKLKILELEPIVERFFGTDGKYYTYTYFPAIYGGSKIDGLGDGELMELAIYPITDILEKMNYDSVRSKCLLAFMKHNIESIINCLQ
jgi:8-oxo-dGTP pyrophosphatase MutT (NUDIX family)